MYRVTAMFFLCGLAGISNSYAIDIFNDPSVGVYLEVPLNSTANNHGQKLGFKIAPGQDQFSPGSNNPSYNQSPTALMELNLGKSGIKQFRISGQDLISTQPLKLPHPH